jgi:rhodanese-related sulfurtransferase
MTTPEIDVDELARRRSAGAPLVDVRQPDEYREAHVPGAQLIPLDQLPDRLEELPAGRPVLVVCRSGARSAAAVDFLLGQGVDAVNVAGGTSAWIAGGHEVATGDEAG